MVIALALAHLAAEQPVHEHDIAEHARQQHARQQQSDGQPIRATLDVTFQQVESEGTYPPTNPTSYAEVNKVRVVMPGETIDSIAFDEYGDAKHWKLLADQNCRSPITIQGASSVSSSSITMNRSIARSRVSFGRAVGWAVR